MAQVFHGCQRIGHGLIVMACWLITKLNCVSQTITDRDLFSSGIISFPFLASARSSLQTLQPLIGSETHSPATEYGDTNNRQKTVTNKFLFIIKLPFINFAPDWFEHQDPLSVKKIITEIHKIV